MSDSPCGQDILDECVSKCRWPLRQSAFRRRGFQGQGHSLDEHADLVNLVAESRWNMAWCGPHTVGKRISFHLPCWVWNDDAVHRAGDVRKDAGPAITGLRCPGPIQSMSVVLEIVLWDFRGDVRPISARQELDVTTVGSLGTPTVVTSSPCRANVGPVSPRKYQSAVFFNTDMLPRQWFSCDPRWGVGPQSKEVGT